MVRFIIKTYESGITNVIPIYIPLWLDLLLITINIADGTYQDLHSTMVRFIIHQVCLKLK